MDERRKVRDDSDALLAALDDMKRMEKEKRDEDISTPRFHQLADRVEDQAKRVFRLAVEENDDGDRAPTSDATTNETRPTNDRSN